MKYNLTSKSVVFVGQGHTIASTLLFLTTNEITRDIEVFFDKSSMLEQSVGILSLKGFSILIENKRISVRTDENNTESDLIFRVAEALKDSNPFVDCDAIGINFDFSVETDKKLIALNLSSEHKISYKKTQIVALLAETPTTKLHYFLEILEISPSEYKFSFNFDLRYVMRLDAKDVRFDFKNNISDFLKQAENLINEICHE
jgi:hypothetical protein